MISRRSKLGALTAGGVAIAVATALPALASDPPTLGYVSYGSSAAGTIINFTAKNTTVFSLFDLRSGASFSCPIGTVNITGTTKVVSGVSPNSLAQITGITFPTSPSAADVCKFSGLPVAPISAKSKPTTPATAPALATGGATSLPWNVNATYQSRTAEGGTTLAVPPPPAKNWETNGNITNVLVQAVLNTSGGSPTPNCGIELGDGTGLNVSGTIEGNAPGATNRVYFLNGDSTVSPVKPSTLKLLSNKTGTVKLGVNQLYNPSTLAVISTPTNPGNGCAAGALKAGDKAFIAGVNSTTPATFEVTTTGGSLILVGAK